MVKSEASISEANKVSGGTEQWRLSITLILVYFSVHLSEIVNISLISSFKE